jgi:hypothetical protein
MKKLTVCCTVLAGLLSMSAFADDAMTPAPTSTTPSAAPAPAGSMAMTGGPSANHPCKTIMEACKSAGFMKGGHASGKGMMEDCIKPIMSGQTVSGVTVDPADVSACQAKRAAHQK